MLPLFVLADSDIEEEELKPIILKMKRKLRRLGKRKRKNSSVVINNKCTNGCQLKTQANDADTGSSHQSTSTVKHKAHCGVNPLCKCNHDNIAVGHSKVNGIRLLDSSATSKDIGSELCSCSPAKYQKLNSCISNANVLKDPNQFSHGPSAFQIENNPVSVQGDSAANDIKQTTLPEPNVSVDTSKFVALDCEFVGVGLRKTSALGRCSILDFHGKVLLDIYVRPEEVITDFRTPWSGIRKKHMVSAIPFHCARETVINILKDKIVVGHALFNDFKVLSVSHPWEYVRDTANYKPLRLMSDHGDGQKVSLKKLAKALLGRDIQNGEHCSCEDARASLDLYKLVQSDWEEKLADRKLRRFQRSVSPVVKERLKTFEVSYLGDEFWPADLFEPSTQTL